MSEKTTISGDVLAVQFDPARTWFLTVQVRDYGSDWYQLDGATFSVNDNPCTRWQLMEWLIGREGDYAGPGKYRTVSVTITGDFGPYPTVERAEFVEYRKTPETPS